MNWARLETKKFQIELATTCNKNEQQQDAKSNAELLTKWTKTTWKTLERVLDETETGLRSPTGDDNDDDDDGDDDVNWGDTGSLPATDVKSDSNQELDKSPFSVFSLSTEKVDSVKFLLNFLKPANILHQR